MLNLQLDEKYSSESIRDYVYRMIKKNILYFNLKPGESLSENTIGAALNASRTPIRETFGRLLADGLLEIYPQKGTYVSLIDEKRVKESLFMRSVLEEANIKMACDKFPEQILFELESNLNQQNFCYEKGRFTDVFELDNKMHELLFIGCSMEHIWQAIQSISADQNRICFLGLSSVSNWQLAIKEHHLFIKSIKEKDAETACNVMHNHIGRLQADIEHFKTQYSTYFKKL